jgi:hypothetical protein
MASFPDCLRMLSGKLTLSRAAPLRCPVLHVATVGDPLRCVRAITYVGPQHPLGSGDREQTRQDAERRHRRDARGTPLCAWPNRA